MPALKKIVIQNFRNIELQELELSPNVNCISGGNGEGKTNLLDAIWYLSMTKSAFSSSDRFSFRHGCDSFALSGVYSLPDGRETRISIRTDGNEKKVRRDDKPYSKVSEHIGLLPIVMVSPADTALVSESGEERRKFMNAVLSQMDREYLSSLQQYNRILLQRNKMLKDGIADEDYFRILDERLDTLSRPVYEIRKSFCERLEPTVRRHYAEISGEKEDVRITYRSDIASGSLAGLLASRRDRDMALRFTGAGIQRDDLEFTMNGFPIRRCGSQGQQKSFLVALKFAQYELMKESCGSAPMLLLDDLFDKLDMDRVSNLLKMVSGNDFGQIFLTDSDKVRLGGIVDGLTSDRKYFVAQGGAFRKADE